MLQNTRVPSAAELRECDRIVLTSAEGWDPHNVTFKISSVKTLNPEPTYGELLQQTTKIHLSPVHISGVAASKSTTKTTALQLSQQRNIGLSTAEATLRNATMLSFLTAMSVNIAQISLLKICMPKSMLMDSPIHF